MPDERWKPLIGTPSKPPIPSNILVPDPSPTRSLISEAESPTLLPPSPEGSFVHRRRQGQYVPRPPVWKIYDYKEACVDTYDAEEVGSSLQEKSTHFSWPLQLPGIDQGQVIANVFNSQPLIVNMMTGHGTEPSPAYQDTVASTAIPQAYPDLVQSNSLLTSEEKHKQPHDRMTTGIKRDPDGMPVDSGYPSTRNTAPVSTPSASTSDSSEKAFDRLHAKILTNPDPFVPRPQRPERTYSSPVSPKTKDPLRMYPGDEAQVVNIHNVPPPRIEDHPSLMSGGKSVAAPGSANNEAVIPPSAPAGQTKSSPQMTSTKLASPAMPTRIARVFAMRPGMVLRGASTAPVVADEGATSSNRSAQRNKKERAKDQRRSARSRSMQLPTVTIPLQTVPLKIHLHVSDVPESQYLEAKIISAQPYYPPTEDMSISSDLARCRSLMLIQPGLRSKLDSSGANKAHESPRQGTQDEAVPVEMSGALAHGSPRPRETMLKTLKKSIGRSFKRSKLFSKNSGSVTSGKPEDAASSEDDHSRTLSELRGAIPRFPLPEGEPSNCPGIRGPCTPEPSTDPVPNGSSPANRAAIQSNAVMIASQSPSHPVNHWVEAQGSAQLGDDEDSSSQSLSKRAGNAERVSQPHRLAQSPTVEGSVPGRSHQDPVSTSNDEGSPAGDWAFGVPSNPSRTQNHQPFHESEPPRNGTSADSDGSDTIRAPPPATRQLPIRLKQAAKENEGYGHTGFGGIAPSA